MLTFLLFILLFQNIILVFSWDFLLDYGLILAFFFFNFQNGICQVSSFVISSLNFLEVKNIVCMISVLINLLTFFVMVWSGMCYVLVNISWVSWCYWMDCFIISIRLGGWIISCPLYITLLIFHLLILSTIIVYLSIFVFKSAIF